MTIKKVTRYIPITIIIIVVSVVFVFLLNGCGPLPEEYNNTSRITEDCAWQATNSYLQLPGCTTYTLKCGDSYANCFLVDCGQYSTSSCK